MKFSILNLLVATALVAIVSATVGKLGVEVAVLVIFLMVANVVITARFYLAYKTGEPDVAWTVLSACVVYPLTIVVARGVLG